MNELFKWVAGKLPNRIQQELKRYHFRRQLHSGTFITAEPEYARLSEWINDGDWVIDVGANIGHYTLRMSQLAGPRGRVLAFEPVPATFELLSSNVSAANCCNVTLFNVAASDRTSAMGISMPRFSTGLTNFYMAQLTPSSGQFEVLTLGLDFLTPPKPVSLVKIDVEGHELQALRGMRQILIRDRPRLIVEGTSDDVLAFLREMNYEFERMPSSPNTVFFPADPDRVQTCADLPIARVNLQN